MAKWGTHGERYVDNIKKADAVLERERVLRERMAPALYVTEKAEELETDAKLAQELGRALTKAMGGSGPVGGYRFEIKVVRDEPAMQYVITVIDRGLLHLADQDSYLLRDETLATCTRSVAVFNSWITAAARLLSDRFSHTRTAPGTDGWMESKVVRPGSAPWRKVADEANDALHRFGLLRSLQAHDEYTEAEAIRSIRRALGHG